MKKKIVNIVIIIFSIFILLVGLNNYMYMNSGSSFMKYNGVKIERGLTTLNGELQTFTYKIQSKLHKQR
ncbi:hypothetical protein [Clostridium sp. UBA6640]|uniref:hypothetical protein n=1 Tax=Clostridium sp. UBA6640 TaxID=1946370 RepID=UPI0025BD1913|nr:hypothetical protein [Clostridium sp. UBA6640]